MRRRCCKGNERSGKAAPHPALRGHLPPREKAWGEAAPIRRLRAAPSPLGGLGMRTPSPAAAEEAGRDENGGNRAPNGMWRTRSYGRVKGWLGWN
nr:MAG TPA: hypothetical protein [Bacteriophage sp.]